MKKTSKFWLKRKTMLTDLPEPIPILERRLAAPIPGQPETKREGTRRLERISELKAILAEYPDFIFGSLQYSEHKQCWTLATNINGKRKNIVVANPRIAAQLVDRGKRLEEMMAELSELCAKEYCGRRLTVE